MSGRRVIARSLTSVVVILLQWNLGHGQETAGLVRMAGEWTRGLWGAARQARSSGECVCHPGRGGPPPPPPHWVP